MKIKLIGLFLIISISVAAKAEVQLTSVTLSQWQKQLQTYQGKIVVVDNWATWCISCLERFPEMVKLSEEYPQVVFTSLLLEDPEEPEAIDLAKLFLAKQKADFEHFFMNENLMVSFEKLDLLGIPAVFVYAQDGKLYKKLTGDNPNQQFTEKDIEQTILELIGEE